MDGAGRARVSRGSPAAGKNAMVLADDDSVRAHPGSGCLFAGARVWGLAGVLQALGFVFVVNTIGAEKLHLRPGVLAGPVSRAVFEYQIRTNRPVRPTDN